jgi:hypothetical protein
MARIELDGGLLQQERKGTLRLPRQSGSGLPLSTLEAKLAVDLPRLLAGQGATLNDR